MSALELSAAEYHRDETGDTPSLSASIAARLVTQSPAHAWANHPRLNPDYEHAPEDRFAIGTVSHALLLEGVDAAHVCHFPDWRSNAAKEARDTALAHGRIPLLAKDWARVQAMVDAANRQLDAFNIDPRPFTDGEPEKCLTWEMDGVRCRALIDWLHTGAAFVTDYKTTSASAHPAAWAKTALGFSADVQVAFHSAGVEAVYGVRPTWRYVAQETYPPYALSVVEPDAQWVALGADKVKFALSIWRSCLETDCWPAYPTAVTRISPPAWSMTAWLERNPDGQVAW